MYVCICTFLFLPLLHCQNCCPSPELGSAPVLLLPAAELGQVPLFYFRKGMDETERGLEEERSSKIRRKDLETVQNEIVSTGEKANG